MFLISVFIYILCFFRSFSVCIYMYIYYVELCVFLFRLIKSYYISVRMSPSCKVLDLDTKAISRPLDVVWCGEDSVVLHWRNTGIVMVGPYGHWVNIPYTGNVVLISELDCVRVVSSDCCDLLQRVPLATEMIQRIGSTHSAALLYDVMEAYEAGDPKSDENIRSLAASNQLPEAIDTCIAAAAVEFDISKQQVNNI